MDRLFALDGKVAVVTGGLGQLGTQFARTFRERGARVAILDLAPPDAPAAQAAAALDRTLYVQADVLSRASLEAALVGIVQVWEAPHVLVNNAALDAPPDASAAENGPFEHYPEASFDQVMDVNVKGIFLACQVFGGRMAEEGRGSIINIGSIYGVVSPDQRIYEYRARSGAPFMKPVSYCVSKAALPNLTRYLSTYWAQRGVRVNMLTFGGVYRNQDPQFLAGYTARVPLGRMAREDEYNGAIVFLASDASSYMTGSNVVLDGGWTAW